MRPCARTRPRYTSDLARPSVRRINNRADERIFGQTRFAADRNRDSHRRRSSEYRFSDASAPPFRALRYETTLQLTNHYFPRFLPNFFNYSAYKNYRKKCERETAWRPLYLPFSRFSFRNLFHFSPQVETEREREISGEQPLFKYLRTFFSRGKVKKTLSFVKNVVRREK